MQYVLIIQTALAIAKQIQADHKDSPGEEKFGMALTLLTEIFGEADVSKYQGAIKLMVTVAVDAWRAAGKYGFVQKVNKALGINQG